MSESLTTKPSGEAIERVLIEGDLGALTSEQRVVYYSKVCESVGLNALTRPLDYLRLNGKLTLYAKRDATDQLRKLHGVSVEIVGREVVDDCYVVTAQAQDKTGRLDSSIGAVPIANLKGENKANAMMKAETKAKRRVTLSICGLGILDETEVASIPDAERVDGEHAAAKTIPAKKAARSATHPKTTDPAPVEPKRPQPGPLNEAQTKQVEAFRIEIDLSDSVQSLQRVAREIKQEPENVRAALLPVYTAKMATLKNGSAQPAAGT